MKDGFALRVAASVMAALALALLPAPAALAAKAATVKELSSKAGTKKQAAAKDRASKEKAAKEAAAEEPQVVVAKGKLFAIVLGPGAGAKRGQQPLRQRGLTEHYRYWQDLQKQGRIASAGPLGDDAALIILRAKNQSEADAIILADPAVKAHLFRGVARPYAPALVSALVLVGKDASKH